MLRFVASLALFNSFKLGNGTESNMWEERGKEVLKIRSRTVEPVFGVIKENKKLRRFIFRGMSMINSMWRFELAAYNIQKLTKIRMAAPA